ncbi:hypothetical protein GCM10009837_40360 [Streptomyces durmitorensis]|uniref:response regulator transcription factor n=1 Tax=Streptomyces durmitorensis TaxID=319947 RepID=UPI0024BF0005|nr:LuxR C-terminal-related transcriptional regulator [Streptomyces durmitorensis]
MTAALRTESGGGSRGTVGTADPSVTACLVWVAGTLVRIAGDVGDLRSAGALVGEAAAVLALVPEQSRRPVSVPPPPRPLTSCQLVVLCRLQQEVPLREIAEDLYVSVNTVKSHVRAVYRKLGVASRAEAVQRARVLGLVQGGKPEPT